MLPEEADTIADSQLEVEGWGGALEGCWLGVLMAAPSLTTCQHTVKSASVSLITACSTTICCNAV